MARSHTLLTLLAALVPAALAASPLPEHLRDTGLYARGRGERIAADVLPFSPQYPLWSDGAEKRRWIRLPPGTRIDAHDPDRWVFPVGGAATHPPGRVRRPARAREVNVPDAGAGGAG